MDAEWQVEVFYDGACPLCAREIDFLRRKNGKGRIRFTDIADESFDPVQYEGRTLEDFMSRIQGRSRDGSWIEGVEVFRRLYAAAGFGWLVSFTRIPGISHILDTGYRVFARNRLRWTGRDAGRCAADTCGISARV